MAYALSRSPPIEEFDLRATMRGTASSVCVVTAGVGADRAGLTATSVTSLSLEPPTMLACVNRLASALPIIRRYRHFCINFLAADQAAIADRFAGRSGVHGSKRYDGARWSLLETGAAALDGAIASIDCVLEEAVERHSHVVLFGAVSAIRTGGADPLVYAAGGFAAVRPL